MFEMPSAIGYLRRDVSGTRQAWYGTRIRSLARRFGYNLRKTVVFGAHTDHPVQRLIELAQDLEVDAVMVPSADHFAGVVPAGLVRVADVVIVESETTYARWGTGELPGGLGTI